MSARKHIPLNIQLAAALLQLVDGKGDRLVSHEHAKLLTADQVISLYQRDHYPIRVADGGTDEPYNLTWRLRAEHKRKTATVDQPELGKQRRIRAREHEHKEALELKSGEPSRHIKVVSKFPSRPFPKGRKFASR